MGIYRMYTLYRVYMYIYIYTYRDLIGCMEFIYIYICIADCKFTAEPTPWLEA